MESYLLNALLVVLVINFVYMPYSYRDSFEYGNLKLVDELSNPILQEEFRVKIRTADVLIIDNIQFLAGKESTQEEFFHTFNALYNFQKQIIITSDRPPRDIPQLEERLRTRFEGGLITEIQLPNLETKIIILRREAKKEKIKFSDEVMHFIASKIESNIRDLKGAITKIKAYSELLNEEPTEDIIEKILKEYLIEIKSRGLPDKSKDNKTFEKNDQYLSEESISKRLSALRLKLMPILYQKSKIISLDKKNFKKIMVKCGKCGNSIFTDDIKCNNCGIIFEDKMYQCPKCQTPIDPNENSCNYCKTNFKFKISELIEKKKK